MTIHIRLVRFGAAMLIATVLGLGRAPGLRAQAVTSAAALARADSAWAAGRHDDARAAYAVVVAADSTASSRAVYRLAVLRSWENRLTEAIALHRLYVRLEPRDLEGRVGLARVYAWASRFATSVATYDSVLSVEPDYRDAALGRAQAMAWWGRLDAALDAYAAWRRGHPGDTEVALSVARTLSWAGRLGEAEALYDSLAASGGAEAEKGRARVRGWRGDLEASERAWRDLTARYPDDPETWVGHGQVLRWLGRPFDARDAFDEALRRKPGYADAIEQMRWVRAEIAPRVTLGGVAANDSEDNRLDVMQAGAAVSQAWGGRWSVGVDRKTAGAAGDATATAARGGLVWQPRGSRTSVAAELGSARLTRGATSTSVSTWSFRAATVVGERIAASASASRAPIDEVSATIERGVYLDALDAEATVTLPARWSLALAVGRAETGGTLDQALTRQSMLVRARWTWRRGASLAVTRRSTEWSDPAYGIFFAPQEFTLTELGAAWERPRDLGWLARVDAGIGSQSVRFEDDPPSRRTTPRASISGGWRFAPGREVVATYVFANVANSATLRDGEYTYRALTLSARYAY